MRSLTSISLLLPECLSSRSVSESRETQAPRGDVLVTSGGPAGDSLFGSRPVARQFGQCGSRGRRLELPQRALAANQSVDAAAGRAMLREWLKYRFGVFEEAGFEGDRIYPLKFVEGLQELENRGCNDTVRYTENKEHLEHNKRHPPCNVQQCRLQSAIAEECFFHPLTSFLFLSRCHRCRSRFAPSKTTTPTPPRSKTSSATAAAPAESSSTAPQQRRPNLSGKVTTELRSKEESQIRWRISRGGRRGSHCGSSICFRRSRNSLSWCSTAPRCPPPWRRELVRSTISHQETVFLMESHMFAVQSVPDEMI